MDRSVCVMPAGQEQEVSLGVSLWAEIITVTKDITNESQPPFSKEKLWITL